MKKKWDKLKFKHVINRNRSLQIAPPLVLISSFMMLIVLGALCLKLPISTTKQVSWLDCFFTATSAVTVTGLSVQDIGTVFTRFGQTVIIILVQLGGIGIMTFTILTLFLLGKRLGFFHQNIAKAAFSQSDSSSLLSTAKSVFLFSFLVESLGILILSVHWSNDLGWEDSLFHSLFYSVSAFNNAGFALHADNLIPFVADPIVTMTISGLLVAGGLGFCVWIDLFKHRCWHRLSVNSRLMIIGTIILNIGAMLLILGLESNNPDTLGSLSTLGKWLAAWFQAVTPRTAGFNTIDLNHILDSTALIMILLMFIGGGAVSTASGIKVVTFIILILATLSYLRGRKEIHIFKREVPKELVHKAFALTLISLAVCWIGIFILSITEKASLIDIVFEVVSALGTVGLSRSLTPNLTDIGQYTIMVIMMIGRVGPLTFAYFFAMPKQTKLRFAQAKLPIG